MRNVLPETGRLEYPLERHWTSLGKWTWSSWPGRTWAGAVDQSRCLPASTGRSGSQRLSGSRSRHPEAKDFWAANENEMESVFHLSRERKKERELEDFFVGIFFGLDFLLLLFFVETVLCSSTWSFGILIVILILSRTFWHIKNAKKSLLLSRISSLFYRSFKRNFCFKALGVGGETL